MEVGAWVGTAKGGVSLSSASLGRLRSRSREAEEAGGDLLEVVMEGL